MMTEIQKEYMKLHFQSEQSRTVYNYPYICNKIFLSFEKGKDDYTNTESNKSVINLKNQRNKYQMYFKFINVT